MALSNVTTGRLLVEESQQPVIRTVLLEDIETVLELHAQAFSDKFRAAFGSGRIAAGRTALATAYRMQGARGLLGMYLAELAGRTVGTITLRTSELGQDDSPAVERAFYQVLGTWGALRALFALSRLDHSIGRDEGYITDVAVDAHVRRRGVARAMLQHIEGVAQRQGKRYLGLYVSAGNHAARALYLRAGFVEQHSRRSWWTRWLLGERRWIYMRKVLP